MSVNMFQQRNLEKMISKADVLMQKCFLENSCYEWYRSGQLMDNCGVLIQKLHISNYLPCFTMYSVPYTKKSCPSKWL